MCAVRLIFHAGLRAMLPLQVLPPDWCATRVRRFDGRVFRQSRQWRSGWQSGLRLCIVGPDRRGQSPVVSDAPPQTDLDPEPQPLGFARPPRPRWIAAFPWVSGVGTVSKMRPTSSPTTQGRLTRRSGRLQLAVLAPHKARWPRAHSIQLRNVSDGVSPPTTPKATASAALGHKINCGVGSGAGWANRVSAALNQSNAMGIGHQTVIGGTVVVILC